MDYQECNFEKLSDVAILYDISLETAKKWEGKSVDPVPWKDPHMVLEWYRLHYGREPHKKVVERVSILQPQMVRLHEQDNHSGAPHGAAGDPPTGEYRHHIETKEDRDDLLKKQYFEELCADLSNARTLARIASEEREAYDNYQEKKNLGLDYTAQIKRWQDLTKTKREWAKTQDAVDLAFKALKSWLRSEWEPAWKELRTALDGRRMGMEAREDLLATGRDAVEWRRVWDMHMERVLLDVMENKNDL